MRPAPGSSAAPTASASYFAQPRGEVRRRRIVIAAVAAVVVALLAVVGAFALSSKGDRQARDRPTQAQRVAALRARLKRIQAPAPRRGRRPQASGGRRPTPSSLPARRWSWRSRSASRGRAGARRGPGSWTGRSPRPTCGPILKSKTAIPDDRVLSKRIGRYDCVAIKHHIIGTEGAKVAELGYAFVAALNFDTYTYTWCRNTPPPGRGGVALVFVRLERACLAAKGKALGTGYVDVPGQLERETRRERGAARSAALPSAVALAGGARRLRRRAALAPCGA